MIKTLNDYYFEWLCNLVTSGNHTIWKRYTKLLRYLYNKKFYWSIPMDENRYYDALSLREDFLDDFIDIRPVTIEESEESFGKGCNVLEVLAALSRRAVYDVIGDESCGSESDWFWTMLGNLRLDIFSNKDFDYEMADKVVDIFLSRKYEPNGDGNIFIIDDRRDLRTVEIWCQLCWYADYILSE